jgi:AhpD family alkylhydroperoxidase
MMTTPNPYFTPGVSAMPLITFGRTVEAMGLEPSLNELVKMRASQINGCAMCLSLHSSAAIKAGENPMRLFQLAAWRDSPLFSARERAALAWTEALTEIAPEPVREAAYKEVAEQFEPADQVKLTLMITAINSFNRLNIAFRVQPPVEAASVTAE